MRHGSGATLTPWVASYIDEGRRVVHRIARSTIDRAEHLPFRVSRYGVKETSSSPDFPRDYPLRTAVGLPRYEPVISRPLRDGGARFSYPTRNFATLGTFVTSQAGWLGRFSFRLALHVAMKVGPYLHARSSVRVQRMASEDSVEDLVDRALSVLAVAVHRIRDFDDRRQSTGLTVQAALEEMHRIFKQLHVGASRRELHVSPHERQHVRIDVRPRIDREHQNVWISWLWPDPSALEYILHHFE